MPQSPVPHGDKQDGDTYESHTRSLPTPFRMDIFLYKGRTESALSHLNYIVSSLKISMSLPQDLFPLNLKCAFPSVKV